MRAVFYYIMVAVAVAFVLVFFVSQRSRHVQIGYELTHLQRERDNLRELSRKLDFEISRLANRDTLVETARKLGLTLQGPLTDEPARRRTTPR